MNSITNIIEKIERAKDLDFGIIFSNSIELFKKTWLQGFLLQLFSLIVMLPIIIVVYVPLFGLILAQQENGYSDPDAFNAFFASMSVMYVLFVIFCLLVLSTVSVALNAAFFRIMKKLDYGENVETSEFFYFFKKEYLGKMFLLMIVFILIIIPSAMLCYVPLLYVIVPLSYFFIVFAFNPDFSMSDIVKVSFKLGNKKWMITLGLILVGYICVMFVSMATCGLGSLFLNTFLYHPIYLIYKNVIGFDSKDAIDEIGEFIE